jgi:exportin-2 (importin alpha re-exporter)
MKPDEADAAAEDDDALLEEMEANAGYAASYSRLTQGAIKEVDPVPEVTDYRAHLARCLAQFSASRPIAGFVQTLPPDAQKALNDYAGIAGVTFAG